MEKLTFKLEQFEGPLDLLLHLISKHKLNLYDIQIDLLLEQYLADPFCGSGTGQRFSGNGLPPCLYEIGNAAAQI